LVPWITWSFLINIVPWITYATLLSSFFVPSFSFSFDHAVILGGFFILSSLSRSFFSSFIMLLLSCFYLEYKKLFFKNNILKNKNSNTLFLFLFTAVISGPLFMPYLQEQERGIGSKGGFYGMMAKRWPLLFYDSHNGR